MHGQQNIKYTKNVAEYMNIKIKKEESSVLRALSM
jgi:hypothetical protein